MSGVHKFYTRAPNLASYNGFGHENPVFGIEVGKPCFNYCKYVKISPLVVAFKITKTKKTFSIQKGFNIF